MWQNEEEWEGWEFSTYGGGEFHAEFWWGNLRERNHLEDLDAEGRMILNWIFKKRDWGMDWIDLAQDVDKCLALANEVMNLCV